MPVADRSEPPFPKQEDPAPRLGEIRPVDELANFVTHGFGFFLSVLGSALMMTLAADDDPRIFAACGVYCASLVSLYAASTLSHSFYDLRWRRFFRCVDQACIFLLIAGSFTPFAVMFLRDGWWPLLLAAMWALAFLGVGIVLWYRYLSPAAQWVYLILGWLPVIALEPIITRAPTESLPWVLAGGFFYTVGAFILRVDHYARYVHALWHTLVIAGSTCHYVAILLIVTL